MARFLERNCHRMVPSPGAVATLIVRAMASISLLGIRCSIPKTTEFGDLSTFWHWDLLFSEKNLLPECEVTCTAAEELLCGNFGCTPSQADARSHNGDRVFGSSVGFSIPVGCQVGKLQFSDTVERGRAEETILLLREQLST